MWGQLSRLGKTSAAEKQLGVGGGKAGMECGGLDAKLSHRTSFCSQGYGRTRLQNSSDNQIKNALDVALYCYYFSLLIDIIECNLFVNHFVL